MAGDDKIMRVLVTKYALTDGTLDLEVSQSNSYPSMVCPTSPDRRMQTFHGEGKDWHLTEESARKKFNDMKAKKVASIKKQLKRLEALEYTVKVEPFTSHQVAGE